MFQFQWLDGQEHCGKRLGSLDLAGDYQSVQEVEKCVAIQIELLFKLMLDSQELW